MLKREIVQGVYLLAAIDWDRRLFDSLIPLPQGTSYNAYLVQGKEKIAVLDAVDPTMSAPFLEQFAQIEKVDYIIAHHGEQDHSGSIPLLLKKYPQAQVLVSARAKEILQEHLLIPEEKMTMVSDGERLDLGGMTLRFIYTPWVHWPETMVSYLEEEGILFTCDFFGSHLASSSMFYSPDEPLLPAKRYYAEIMMPFRNIIEKNLEKLPLDLKIIAPSHGPLWSSPSRIISAYKEWTSSSPQNKVLIVYVSMHNSTRLMVDYLADSLIQKGITVERFELPSTDLGEIAMALVDAATLVLGTPTVLAGAHPYALFASNLVNALRPKLRHVALIGSYGWGGKTVEQVTSSLSNLKLELFEPLLVKGLPKEGDWQAVEDLADKIASRHKEEGLR